MHRSAPQRERVYLRRSLAPSDQVYTAPRAPPKIACPRQPGDKEERPEDVRRMLNTFERRVVYGLRPSVKARPAPVHSIPAEASRREPSATAPDELVKRVLASGLYVPCEAHGATVVERCHQNTSGAAAGLWRAALTIQIPHRDTAERDGGGFGGVTVMPVPNGQQLVCSSVLTVLQVQACSHEGMMVDARIRHE